jgi:phosphoribosyl-ATP pyrophosphohydrolase
VDKFDEMFGIQKDFTKKFFKSKKLSLEGISNNKEELVKWNKEYILALIAEATEVLNEVDWKMHKNMEMPVDARDRLLEESVDVMKFLLGLMIVNGFSCEEIYSKFISKSLKVVKKFDKEQHAEIQKKLYGGN